MDCRFKLRVIHLLPGFRFELFARVGPEIAVVEIEQEFYALGLHALRQRQRVFQIVTAAPVGISVGILRIHPQTQAHIVHAVGFQNGNRILLLAILVIKCCAMLFRLEQRRDVRPLNKVCRHGVKRTRFYPVRGERTRGKTARKTNSKQSGFESFHGYPLVLPEVRPETKYFCKAR